MATEKQALVELTKISKALTKEAKALKKKAKKIKLKDLLEPENINTRINTFLDKLTLADGLQFIAFISVISLAYPHIYNIKSKAWWKALAVPMGLLLGIIPGLIIWFWPEEEEKVEFDPACFAVTIIVAYAIVYKTETLLGLVAKILGVGIGTILTAISI